MLVLMLMLILLTSRTWSLTLSRTTSCWWDEGESWHPTSKWILLAKHSSKWVIITEYLTKDVCWLSTTLATHHEPTATKRILLLSSKWKVPKRSCILLLLLILLSLLVLLFVLLLLPFSFFFSILFFLLSILTWTHSSLSTHRFTCFIANSIHIPEILPSLHVGRCKWCFLFLFFTLFLFFLRLHLRLCRCLF